MEQSICLTALRPGECAAVEAVGGEAAICRRLKDLGLICGTRVTCLFQSPAGDPVAYQIRGAVIALRNCDAERVTARRIEAEPSPAARAHSL